MKRRKTSRHAFSLVELLMTTLIIGACYGALAQAYGSRRGVADEHSCAATRHTLAGALEAYNLAYNQKTQALASVLPALVREGYLAHLPADPGVRGGGTHKNFSFDGREVVCAVHRGMVAAPPAGVDWPVVGLPLLAFVYALARYLAGARGARSLKLRVAMPVIDPLSGPIGAAATVAAAPAPVAVQCHFCHSIIENETQEEDGHFFHQECGTFYREKLYRS